MVTRRLFRQCMLHKLCFLTDAILLHIQFQLLAAKVGDEEPFVIVQLSFICNDIWILFLQLQLESAVNLNGVRKSALQFQQETLDFKASRTRAGVDFRAFKASFQNVQMESFFPCWSATLQT